MICINCTFHYSVWSFHLLFSYKFWNVWHQLICWFNVSWTLSFLDVVNVLQSLLLMSLHVVLPHCLYSDVLVLIVVHFVITWGLVFLRCLSVCYIICDYHWFWFSPIAVLGWYVNVSNSWFQTSWCQVTDADFITPTLLCLLPLSRLVIFVSIPLHDGCISCRLYNMYLLFLCTDLCPLLR